MKRLLLPLALLAIVSVAGNLLCRTFSHGADQDRLFRLAAERVARLPEQVGPWRASAGEEMASGVLNMLECRAHESRTYVDEHTGDQVGLMLLAGPAGPLVAHTAEVCYGSVAFDIVDPPVSETVRGTGAQADVVHKVTFRSNSVTAQKQRVYYAWREFEGPWQAPESPRFTLGGLPMLYKLQLVGAAPPVGKESLAADPARRFLLDLLPALDKTLSAK
jgi:hypothetical protein